MKGLVSVIIPAYNRSDLILDTLESVRMQSYEPVEIIVVDDGSTDTTSTVVLEWHRGSAFHRFTLLTLEKNIGKSAAVNKAFAVSNGEYVMILDSDDLLYSEALRYEVDYLCRHPEVGAVFGNAYELRDGRKTTVRYGVPFFHLNEFTDLNLAHGDLLLRGNVIVASTVLIRKTIVDLVGSLNTKQRYVHDWDYWIRIARQSTIGFVNQEIVSYRVNSPGSSSADRYATFRETVELMYSAQALYARYTLLKALALQTERNAWLAYRDRNLWIVLKILLAGLYSLAKLALMRL